MNKTFAFISAHLKIFLSAVLLILLGLPLISHSMLPAAIRTNFWSVKTLPFLFSEIDTMENISPPPDSHPHGKIWMARLSLTSKNPQNTSNPIEVDDPQGLQIDENDLQALDAKARSLYQQEQFTEAFTIWREIGQKAALEEAAKQALNQEEIDLAIKAYQAAYQIDPEGYAVNLVRAMRDKQEDDLAIAVLQEVIQEYPDSSKKESWLMLLGEIYQEQGALEEAESAYKEALNANPAAWGAWINLGWLVYERDQDFKTAKEYFENAIAMDPERGDGYYAIGQLYAEEENLDQALTWYQQSVELNPDNRFFHITYANTLRETKQYDLAIQEYQTIARANPNWDGVFYNIAWAYHQNNQPAEGINAIEKAIELMNPPKIYYYLRAGIIYEANNMTEEALTSYQAIIDLNPENNRAKQAIERLTEPN